MVVKLSQSNFIILESQFAWKKPHKLSTGIVSAEWKFSDANPDTTGVAKNVENIKTRLKAICNNCLQLEIM